MSSTTFIMTLPDLGEGIVEAELIEWLVVIGDIVQPGSPLAEVLTDKATVELTAPVEGRIAQMFAEAGAIVTVGSEFVGIDREAEGRTGIDEPSATNAKTDVLGAAEPNGESEKPLSGADIEPLLDGGPPTLDPTLERPRSVGTRRARAAPTVRRRARDVGVDLESVVGTGPGGRVVVADVERARCGAPSSGSAAENREVSIRGLRRTIAGRMTRAWTEIPHITYVEEVDVESVEQFRVHQNESSPTPGATLLTYIGRAIVVACTEHPHMNATYDSGAEVLHVRGAVDLGIATQTDHGLLVPVVRDAGSLSISELSSTIRRLSERARQGALSRDELSGSTITISSLGKLGGISTTPIINHPEVAVIGVNRITMRPRWTGSCFEPRRMVNLSSSFDHRIIDGWEAAMFVQRIKALLEEPADLTLGWRP